MSVHMKNHLMRESIKTFSPIFERFLQLEPSVVGDECCVYCEMCVCRFPQHWFHVAATPILQNPNLDPLGKPLVCTQTLALWLMVIHSSQCVEELTQISKLWWYNQRRSGADILWLSLCSSTYPDKWGTWVHCAGSGATRQFPGHRWWLPVHSKHIEMTVNNGSGSTDTS